MPNWGIMNPAPIITPFKTFFHLALISDNIGKNLFKKVFMGCK